MFSFAFQRFPATFVFPPFPWNVMSSVRNWTEHFDATPNKRCVADANSQKCALLMNVFRAQSFERQVAAFSPTIPKFLVGLNSILNKVSSKARALAAEKFETSPRHSVFKSIFGAFENGIFGDIDTQRVRHSQRTYFDSLSFYDTDGRDYDTLEDVFMYKKLQFHIHQRQTLHWNDTFLSQHWNPAYVVMQSFYSFQTLFCFLFSFQRSPWWQVNGGSCNFKTAWWTIFAA